MGDARSGGRGRAEGPSAWLVGIAWTLVVAVMWAALATARPTTTWHLAPLILAASLPLMVMLDGVVDAPSATRRVLAAGALTFAVTVAEAIVLAASGQLQGAAFLGGPHPLREAIGLAVIGAGAGSLAGLLHTRRAESGPEH